MTQEKDKVLAGMIDLTAFLPPLSEGIFWKPEWEEDFDDSYKFVMTVAGAEVLAMKSFGSYQGDWIAFVRAGNSPVSIIKDYFGSCSGCDAFEAEFGWRNERTPIRLATFGRKYLADAMTIERAIEQASENLEWDSDAAAMVEWIKATAKEIEDRA